MSNESRRSRLAIEALGSNEPEATSDVGGRLFVAAVVAALLASATLIDFTSSDVAPAAVTARASITLP